MVSCKYQLGAFCISLSMVLGPLPDKYYGQVGSRLVSTSLDLSRLVSRRLSLKKFLSRLSFEAVDLEEVETSIKVSSRKSGETKSEFRRRCLVRAKNFGSDVFPKHFGSDAEPFASRR